MVKTDLALGLLQLVALSLPAFAILLQMVVESDFPYTKEAVPITTAGFSFFLLAGLVILADFLVSTGNVGLQVVLGIIGLGLTSMLMGMILIGLQTQHAQEEAEDAIRQEHEAKARRDGDEGA